MLQRGVRRFVTGLLTGALLGGGGAYVALEKPWARGESEGAAIGFDAGPADTTGKDDKPKRRRKGKRKNAELQEIDETIELSAADRKVVWKGPEVSLPTKSMDFGAEGEGRSLDQNEINAGVARGQDSMMSCIAEARGAAPLTATITFKMLVDGGGRVTKYRVQAPTYLFKNGLYECAGRAVRSTDFPGTGGFTVVTIPFELN